MCVFRGAEDEKMIDANEFLQKFQFIKDKDAFILDGVRLEKRMEELKKTSKFEVEDLEKEYFNGLLFDKIFPSRMNEKGSIGICNICGSQTKRVELINIKKQKGVSFQFIHTHCWSSNICKKCSKKYSYFIEIDGKMIGRKRNRSKRRNLYCNRCDSLLRRGNYNVLNKFRQYSLEDPRDTRTIEVIHKYCGQLFCTSCFDLIQKYIYDEKVII